MQSEPSIGWAFSLSTDEPKVLSTGLSPGITMPVMETPLGTMIPLLPDRARALLYARAGVQQGIFEPGEYTFYEVVGLPEEHSVQEIVVEFDQPSELNSLTVRAISPPQIPAKYIRVIERKVLEKE